MLLQKITAENHAIMKYYGFKIKVFDTNYHVYVPDKWYTVMVNREKHHLYDPQQRLRGEYLIKSTPNDISLTVYKLIYSYLSTKLFH